MLKRYLLYLVRWQLSTPILAVILIWLSSISTLWATVIANLIGGLIFFWVDKFIFRSLSPEPLWEIHDDVQCADCGVRGKACRIVEWRGYSRKNDQSPQYRRDACKDAKQKEVKNKAI